ncbi:MAG: nucleotide exchange factor GrpE [Coriobacteriia bacterium]|jgi:molecular chaperone GrpE|nr:nucleotide exchange factor GrpE [Coriobacteriia bacterium]
MSRKPRDTGEIPIDPELESDLGAEFEMRGDQLAAELEEAREEAARNLETAQRVQAEFDNFRKRMARDHTDAVKRAGERIVAHLLPIVDNLERAIDHSEASGGDSDVLAGVEMVLGQLLDVLAKEGVQQVDPSGQQFDPLKHQAVGQKEDPAVPEGTVVEVYQKGYDMHGRTIRSAMVVVAAGGPAPAGE